MRGCNEELGVDLAGLLESEASLKKGIEGIEKFTMVSDAGVEMVVEY